MVTNTRLERIPIHVVCEEVLNRTDQAKYASSVLINILYILNLQSTILKKMTCCNFLGHYGLHTTQPTVAANIGVLNMRISTKHSKKTY